MKDSSFTTRLHNQASEKNSEETSLQESVASNPIPRKRNAIREANTRQERQRLPVTEYPTPQVPDTSAASLDFELDGGEVEATGLWIEQLLRYS